MRRFRSTLICILLPVLTIACSTWRPIPGGPGQAAEVARNDKVRVTLVSSGEREVLMPELVDTLLTGFGDRCVEERVGLAAQHALCDPLEIPLAEIDEIAARRFSPFNTLALLGGLVAIGAVLDAAVNPGVDFSGTFGN